MRRRRLSIILGSVVVLIVTAAVIRHVLQPKPLYRVTFLPSLGGIETRAHALNDSGRVVTGVRMADGTTRIVLWDKSGRTEDLGSFPRDHILTALVINDAGQVAGTIFDPNRVWSSFFLDRDGRRYAIDAPGQGEVQMKALNGRGQVVGHWNPPRGPRHAFLWDTTDGMRDLGTFGGIESLATDLNDWGQIVGFFSAGNRDWRAFVYDPNLGVRDLGPSKFGPDGTCCINNQGFVVGQFGSTQPGICISIWTAHTGPQRLPPMDGDMVQVRGVDDANRYFVNVQHLGIHVLGRRFGEQSESHLWESDRHIHRLDRHLCRGDTGRLRRSDIEAIGGGDINKAGTILVHMKMNGPPHTRSAILEPLK